MAQNIIAQLAEGVTSVSMRHSIVHEGFRMALSSLGMTGIGDVPTERPSAPMQMKPELDEGGEEKG